MKHLLHITLLLLSITFLSSCKDQGPKPEDLALQAAKVYYEQLVNGDINSFVEGSLKGDSISPAYRKQLVLNMQMYLETINKSHRGIKAIEAVRATADTATHTANAFLAISFGDSIREEIVVPMVEKDGIWYMK